MHPRARVAGLVTAAVLAAAGVLWAAGGLDAAGAPARVPPGHEVDQHLFRTRLVGAHLATINGTKYVPGRRLLVINAWVTNPTRQTVGTHSGVSDDVFSHGLFLHWNARNGPRPKLTDAQGIAGDTLFRGLQPRLPTYVAVQYELAATTRVPGHVTVALAGYEHTDAGILDPRGYWSWKPRRYETTAETDPLTNKRGRVTRIIPVLVADVTLPVRR